jgi:3-oxoacyl-[acyl-carrier-protein] synthase-3
MPSIAHARPQTALGSIAGIGINRPSSSAALARRVTGSDVGGVSYRVQAEHGITTASLAAGAARAALDAARTSQSEVGMVIVGTASPDVLWPSTACLVQTELKLPMVPAFDLYAAQAGFLTALDVALRYVDQGPRAVLVIGADSDNQLIDLPGQGSNITGRAAGAAVLRGDGKPGGVLSTVAGGSAAPGAGAGMRAMLDGLGSAVDECLRRAGLRLADVDLVIGDQAIPEAMKAWAHAAGLEPARLIHDEARYGSLLSAAPLAVLHDLAADGRLKDGMTLLLIECGSGPVWATACLRWNATRVGEC